MSKDLDGLRSEYMSETKALVMAAVSRQEISVVDLCPRASQTEEDTAEALKKVAKLNRTIADLCNNQRAIEQRSGIKLGIPSLFGHDLPNVLRVLVAVLGAKALSGGVLEVDTRSLGRLGSLAAGAHSPDDLLIVREAFRKSGLLRPHCHVDMGRTLDELANISLTESSFRKLLGLEPDSECDDLMRARALVAVMGKR
jgi:hypothetical protein